MTRDYKEIERIANQNDWRINPDQKLVERIISRQNSLKDTLGQYYCPCKPLRTKENICPCVDARKEIDKTGHCHCNLFQKK
jgi:ferredoxin-thioredoxin reductase catalytic chain